MDLLRHWRRSTFGAAAAVLVVPGAIVLAAVAVGLGGGGIGGLGALPQAFNGPEASDIAPAPLAATARDAERLVARVVAAQAPATQGTATAPATSRERDRTRPTRPAATVVPPSATTAPVATAPTAAPASPAPATPQPAAAPTRGPVKQVTDTVTQITDQVPVVGTPAGDLVDDVADTVDGLVP